MIRAAARRASLAAPLLLALLAGGGCGSARGPAPIRRPAAEVDLPFLVLEGESTRAARAGEGCRNPLVDPRDGSRLRLVRSREGTGDYEVPPGRYGVGAGELLRVDCASGRALGVVADRN